MTGDQSSEFAAQSAVAKCCLNAAQMLHVADDDQDHPPEKRRTFQKYNRGQARLLVEAAKQSDEMLDALRDATRILNAVRYSAGLGKNQLERLTRAMAVIAKAEGK